MQDLIIHQTDIYHEEDTTKQANLAIFNSLMTLTYKHNQFSTIIVDDNNFEDFESASILRKNTNA